MIGLVVFLVLVPARLVFSAIWAHLPGEAETEKNEAGTGQLWRAVGLQRSLPRPLFPLGPSHLAPPSPAGAELPPGACRVPAGVAPRPGRKEKRP